MTDASPRPPKIPVSVLVVIHTAALEVLLIERADRPGFWQSVTGALDADDEPPCAAARREVREETGIDADAPGARLSDWRRHQRYEIYAHWRHRYAAGVTHNIEHAFGLCVPRDVAVRLSAHEHLAFEWLPWQAAAARCFSPSNAEAIRELPWRTGAAPRPRAESAGLATDPTVPAASPAAPR